MDIVECYNKFVTVDRDRDDEILGFDTDFNVLFCYASCFQKVNFQKFNLCAYINFELPSAFLYALCELLEE